MINENHFQFEHKSFFNFWNRKSFSEFKLFILAHTLVIICHCRTLEFVGSSSLPSKVLNFGIRMPESSGTRRILAITSAAVILPVMETCNCRRNPATSGCRCQILTEI
jgi:hypothetical protein